MKTLTTDEALALLRDVVKEYGPQTTYPQRYTAITGAPYRSGTCRNLLTDGLTGKQVPACIVGVVLSKVVPIEKIPGSGAITGSTSDRLRREAALNIPSATAWVLGAAQRAQDQGSTWGAALAAAEQEARNES